MLRRKVFLAIGASLVYSPLANLAQPAAKLHRIGFLAGSSRPEVIDSSVFGAFTRGMRELGYVEGKNFVMEWRFADGKFGRLPDLATELVRLKVDVIVTGASVAVGPAKKATSDIPIVMGASTDPVGAGFVASLARPGGNITGVASSLEDFSAKHLELLMIAVPNVTRVALLVNPSASSARIAAQSVQAAGEKVSVKILRVEGTTPEEIERGFMTMASEGAQALVVVFDALFFRQRRRIAELAFKHRLPWITAQSEYVEAGGLMSYGQPLAESYRRSAAHVVKILKGAKPGDLPIEQPTIFELWINRKTAKALGLRIPQELIFRADGVIE